MKNDNFERCLELVLNDEGGFVNHPKDPGKATNKGVTISTFRSIFGHSKTVEDLKNITDEQLKNIYFNTYWQKCRCSELPHGLDYAVFDTAVNSGPKNSAKFLQSCLPNVNKDGYIGDKTIEAVKKIDVKLTIKLFCKLRLNFLKSLKTWDIFKKGWVKRVENVEINSILLFSEYERELVLNNFSTIGLIRNEAFIVGKIKEVAEVLNRVLQNSKEKDVLFRKLIEAKDCAIRCERQK